MHPLAILFQHHIFMGEKEKELSWVSPLPVPVLLVFFLFFVFFLILYTVRPLMACACIHTVVVCMGVRVTTNSVMWD